MAEASGADGDAAPSSEPELVEPVVSEAALQELEGMGFSRNRCGASWGGVRGLARVPFTCLAAAVADRAMKTTPNRPLLLRGGHPPPFFPPTSPPPSPHPKCRAVRALHGTGTDSVEAAVTWLEQHGEDTDIDMPLLVPKASLRALRSQPMQGSSARGLRGWGVAGESAALACVRPDTEPSHPARSPGRCSQEAEKLKLSPEEAKARAAELLQKARCVRGNGAPCRGCRPALLPVAWALRAVGLPHRGQGTTLDELGCRAG